MYMYTVVNGERRRIKPYMTKAGYANRINGLAKAVAILTAEPEYTTCDIHQKIVADYMAQITVFTEKMNKTRY